MFCNVNMDKYKKKHSELSQLELARKLAKAFSKLSSEEKQVYEIMAMESKGNSLISIKKEDDAKEPSLKADKKSSVKTKAKSVESKLPVWAAIQRLYKNEPPRPPE